MPANATVKILYSQYVACGIADYRESRLSGLQASLTSAGHTVCLERLEPSGLRDIVELWVNGNASLPARCSSWTTAEMDSSTRCASRRPERCWRLTD
uniref:Glycosyl transferase family 1 n=1 Tax=Macrostomum lignano TaxID=282301 RepID=A0A1I8JQL5_9PLAT